VSQLLSIACALCGFYLEGSVMAIRELPAPPKPDTHWNYDRTHFANPYGAVALGYLWEARLVDAFVEIRHESAIGTPLDLGEDSVRAGVRWFPFGRAPR
jgi:hypothetical protein